MKGYSSLKIVSLTFSLVLVSRSVGGWVPLELSHNPPPPLGQVKCRGCLPNVGTSPSHSAPPPPLEGGGVPSEVGTHHFEKGRLGRSLSGKKQCTAAMCAALDEHAMHRKCLPKLQFCKKTACSGAPPPPPCMSYANVRNYYGPYAHCSLDKGVPCAQHIQLGTHVHMRMV